MRAVPRADGPACTQLRVGRAKAAPRLIASHASHNHTSRPSRVEVERVVAVVLLLDRLEVVVLLLALLDALDDVVSRLRLRLHRLTPLILALPAVGLR